jgi:hypothetical protein
LEISFFVDVFFDWTSRLNWTWKRCFAASNIFFFTFSTRLLLLNRIILLT